MLFWIFSEKHSNNFVNSSEFLCFQKKKIIIIRLWSPNLSSKFRKMKKRKLLLKIFSSCNWGDQDHLCLVIFTRNKRNFLRLC